MITTLAMVAFGGAIGASCRYLLGLGIVHVFGRTGFPLSIITVNVIGSFAMGVFVILAAQRGLTHLSPLVLTGLFGGFTTFSAFSLETVLLMERGEIGLAALYVLASVVISVSALFLGMSLTRGILV